MKRSGMLLATLAIFSTIAARQTTAATVNFTLTQEKDDPGATAHVSINLDNLLPADAIDLVLSYNPRVATATAVRLGPAASGYTMSSNITQPGIVRISMFIVVPHIGSGTILDVQFAISPDGGTTPLFLTRDDVEEWQVSSSSGIGWLTTDGANGNYLRVDLGVK